jgi:hypothetical protein
VPSPKEHRNGLLVQLLLPRGEAQGVRSQRGHEILRALLASGCRIRVHGDVPLSRVHVCRPWWRTPTVIGASVVGSHGVVVGGVATVVSTIVAILASIAAVAAVVVLVSVVIAAVVGATVVGLARRERCQGW